MRSRSIKSLDGATATGRGKVVGCSGASSACVDVGGIVAGDEVTIEGQNKGSAVWHAAATVITEDGLYPVNLVPDSLAANLTAIAGGGAVTAIIAVNN